MNGRVLDLFGVCGQGLRASSDTLIRVRGALEAAGFGLWLGWHQDYLFDQKADRKVYGFWCKKQRQRIKNPANGTCPWGEAAVPRTVLL